MASRDGLARLLRPRHIAVFGGCFAAEVVRQCERIGFAGALWPVHPTRDEVAGRRCYRGIAELPEAPDASFVAVPREASVDVVAELARRGAGGAVCYASGFAETGEEGARLQDALVEAAGALALVGPNCFGVLNYLDGAALWPDQHGGRLAAEGVAIVTQSGNVGISITMQQRSLPLGYVITVGNQAALGIADYVEALLDDPRVKAIGLHMESVGDIERFSRAAVAAFDRRVPLVALKVGRSVIGKRATLSHTSSVSSDDALYDALFRRLHIARVASVPELLETLKLLAVTGPIGGRRIASISSSGGEAALVADLAERHGLALPELGAERERRLRALLGPLVAVANPLDYHTFIWGDPQAQQACFAAMLEGDQDVTVKVFDHASPALTGTKAWDDTVDAFVSAAAAAARPAVVVSVLPENLPEAARERLAASGIAPLQGLEEGMAALDAGARIGEAFAAGRPPSTLSIPPAVVGEAILLDEWETKRGLAAFGLAVPEGRVALTGDLVAAADELGYPLALKALVPGLAHKSEAGAVALGLGCADDVCRAAAAMPVSVDSFLLERMAPAPVAELLVGVVHDPGLGLALTIGAGGRLVELAGDTRTLLFPVEACDVEQALRDLRVGRLLDGYRGAPRGDWPAAIAAVCAIAAYVEENAARLVELEVNPLLVLPEGRGTLVVDALLRVAERSLVTAASAG